MQNTRSRNTQEIELQPRYRRESSSEDNGPVDPRVTLNAMGTKFVINLSKLKRFSEKTRLGRLQNFNEMTPKQVRRLCDGFDPKKLEFFFDRDPDVLKIILNYLITGEVHINGYFCEIFLENEFKYWMLDTKKLKRCCKSTFDSNYEVKFEKIRTEEKIKTKVKKAEARAHTARGRLWKMTYEPTSSKKAKIYTVFTNIILFCWLIMFLYQTMPETRAALTPLDDTDTDPEPEFGPNSTTTATTPRSYIKLSPDSLSTLFLVVDLVFFSYFFIDAVFRFLLCPEKVEWLKNLLNIIDVFSILGFFVFVGITHKRDSKTIYYIRRVIESTRVALFFKLTRINWRFQTIGKTLRKSYRELILALFFISVSILITSTAMFYCEVSHNSEGGFDSIPATFWWSIVTMTTVGYGDMYPKTAQGKVLCGLVAIWGITLIALPVAIIGTNFSIIYSEEEEKDQMEANYLRELNEKREAVEREKEYQRQKKLNPENDYESGDILVVKNLDFSYHHKLNSS